MGKIRTSRFVRDQRYSESRAVNHSNSEIKRMIKKLDRTQKNFEERNKRYEEEFNQFMNANDFLSSKSSMYTKLLNNIEHALENKLNQNEENLLMKKQLESLFDFNIMFDIDNMKFDKDFENIKSIAVKKLGDYQNKFVNPENMLNRIKECNEIEEEYRNKAEIFMYVFYTFIDTVDVEEYFYFLYQTIINVLFELQENNKDEYKDILIKNIKDVIDRSKLELKDLNIIEIDADEMS